MAHQQQVVWLDVTVDVARQVDGLNGQHGLCNVEAGLLFTQDVLAHQQRLRQCWEACANGGRVVVVVCACVFVWVCQRVLVVGTGRLKWLNLTPEQSWAFPSSAT